MKILLTIPLLLSLNLCIAQPQWKFHIAFEDAIGAKDTLWLIWDTTATGNINGYDTLLNEGPFNFNYNEFNIWTTNDLGDSTKTVALPYNAISFLPIVNAFNCQYPLSIRWDSALFNAPFLPLPVGYINKANFTNDYFYSINNDPPNVSYNMLLDNYAIAPPFSWASQSHFPLHVYIAKDPSLNITNNNDNEFLIYPNPFENQITISTTNEISFEFYTITGNLLISENGVKGSQTLDLSYLPEGIYIIKCLIEKNPFYEKIIKIR